MIVGHRKKKNLIYCLSCFFLSRKHHSICMGTQRQQVCCSPRRGSQNQRLVLSCQKQRQDRAHKWVDRTDVLTVPLTPWCTVEGDPLTSTDCVLFLQRCSTSSRPTASSGAPRDSFWCWLDSGGQLNLCVFVWVRDTRSRWRQTK